MIARSLAVWLLIMSCEAVSGTVRQLVVVPRLAARYGADADLLARRWAFGLGLVIIFGLTLLTVRWMSRHSPRPRHRRLLLVGLIWAALTVGFEIGMGRLMAASQNPDAGWSWVWNRMREDYDPRRGGLMALGLAAMMLSPIAAARIRREL